MSQQPSTLQTILQNFPNILQSLLPFLKPLLERRKREDQRTDEKALSVEDLHEVEIYIVGNVQTYQKQLRVVASPPDEVNMCVGIQTGDITLTTEDGNTMSLQRPTTQTVDIPREILEQLTPGSILWLESNDYVRPDDLVVIRSIPDPLLPTMYEPRGSTTLFFTNTAKFPIRDFELPLPLQQLYPIFGFELQRGGERISNQLMRVGLVWGQVVDNEELQKLGGYEGKSSILNHFAKNRKVEPILKLSIPITELRPKETVTLTIFHSPSHKGPLGYVHSSQ